MAGRIGWRGEQGEVYRDNGQAFAYAIKFNHGGGNRVTFSLEASEDGTLQIYLEMPGAPLIELDAGEKGLIQEVIQTWVKGRHIER